MEVISGSLQQHHLGGDSFSYAWLTHAPQSSFAAAEAGVAAGHAFGSSSRSSYIDMDDAELFSMRWTTTTPTPTGNDFDFGLPVPGSPTQLASASRIFRRGRLLPCDPAGCSEAQEHGDGADVSPRPSALSPRWSASASAPSSPRFRSARSTPLSLSACSSSATSNGGRARRRSSPWKVLLRYVRFLMPLYRKARALAPPRHGDARVAPAAGSPGRGSTSSVDWCHGSADTAVHDAILYCKKSSGQDHALP